MRPYEWLNDDARTILSRGYCREGQTAEERIEEIAKHAGSILGPLFDVEKFIDYTARGFYSFSSPVWANFGAGRGLPCSCNGTAVMDEMESILQAVSEIGMMTKYGSGTSVYLGKLRERGAPISDGGKSNGPVNFARLYEVTTDVISQSDVRRGHCAGYLDIEHPDIMEFLDIQEESSEIQKMSIGVCVGDAFMERLIARDKDAMTVWARVIKKRFESGYPYIFFKDTVNRNAPQVYKDLWMTIFASNMCCEIALPSDAFNSFVCCLSSMNLEQYDEWKDTDAVELLFYFLDAVISDYVRLTEHIPYMERAHRFAKEHRAIGLGVLGWHSYLQKKSIAFESYEAMQKNNEIFKKLDMRTWNASVRLAEEFGCPKLLGNYGMRNTTRLAIAPTTTSSAILGQVSPGIDPYRNNYFVKDLAKGMFTWRNPHLREVLEQHNKDTEETWRSILVNRGSVQHLDFLSEHEKNVFKTWEELSQLTVVQQAAQRQQYIDQAQSLNLMIHPQTPIKEVNALMIEAWKLGVKTLYYQRSPENPAQAKVTEIMTCKACEG